MNRPGGRLSSITTRQWVLEVLAVAVPVVAVLAVQPPSDPSVVAALAACAVLPLRHWWPHLVLVLCFPALLGGLGWGPTLVALFRLGRARPYTRMLACAVLITSAVAILPVVVNEVLAIGQLMVSVTFVLCASGSATALGALVTTRQQLTASLSRLREVTEAESFAKAEIARAEERTRITREIHDAVGHHVTLIAVEAAALGATSGDPEAKESAGRLRGLAKEALAEMRATLGLAAAEDAKPKPTSVDTIPDLVTGAREAGLQVQLCDELDGQSVLAPGVGRAAYRVVQEALTNVSKHAPGSEVTVRLDDRDGGVRIMVVNGPSSGQVVDIGGGGSGLAGLSERVRMAGGRLRTSSLDTGGFELVAVLPHSPC